MRTPPRATDLPLTLLREAIATRWGLSDPQLTYLPLGFGSHHWILTDPASERRWFLTVDDHRSPRMGSTPAASFAALERAMRTSLTLRDRGGLDFVLAPLMDQAGSILAPIDGTAYSLLFFPFVPGRSGKYGTFDSEEDRIATLRLVGAVHAATSSVPADLPRRETFLIPRRGDLLAMFAELDSPWASGPFAEGTRALLRAHRVDLLRALDRFDALVEAVVSDPEPWVVTHGEPHAGNVLHADDGRLLLVDWDTCMIGPKERDLWVLDTGTATDWTPYLATSNATTVSRRTIALYRMLWDLSEISEFSHWFHVPHTETEDTRLAWGGLNRYLPLNPAFLEPVGER